MRTVRRPELRQISSDTFVLSKPGTNKKLFLDTEDVKDLGAQIQMFTTASKTVG